MYKKWCMACGAENDHKNKSCNSCYESFSSIQIEPPKQSAGRTIIKEQDKDNDFEVEGHTVNKNLLNEINLAFKDFDKDVEDLEETELEDGLSQNKRDAKKKRR